MGIRLSCVVACLVSPVLISVGGCGGGSVDSSYRPDPIAFIGAAERGDSEQVDRLLRAGVAIDGRDPSGRTALLAALGSGADAVALRLIAGGANINARAENHDTPWLLAGAEGRVAVLREMIPRGPDLTILNRFGGTALIPACERGHVAAVRVLLTTTIDVDHVNNLGWTCLLEAVILGDGGADHQAIVRDVLAAGANPNRADRAGVTPLAHAERQGFRVIANLLRSRGAITRP